MAQQWGTGQPGYQYPAQTGFAGNAGQFNPAFGVAPQPTGFPGQRPPFQQPQQTGFYGQGGLQSQPTGFQGGGGLQPQPTGFQGGSGFQQQAPPPVPPLPTGFQGGSGFQQQQRPPPPPPPQSSFLNSSPAFGGGLPPQATGYPGASPLVPQMTGFVDPRLQMLSSSFMPANPSIPTSGGPLQFAQGQPAGGLQQSLQQYNQQQAAAPPKMSWALTRAEKKNYDQIFRAWDAQGSGFVSGQMALEVFGQSGLDKPDLAKIWALADTENRGKLNLAEFHVAMGLIYRKLNGMEIPDQLPQELVPPSSRDLDSSVNFLKDILKNDTSRPGSTGSDVISRGKVRSFNDSSPAGGGGRKDATVYKHSDDNDTGSYYRSRSRHVDRNDVRVGNESPTQDLETMRRQLENASRQLEQSAEESASRTREDEELEREMEDLRYRVKRIQEDLDYVSRGPRSTAKDEERRKLERDLLHLMHERIPDVQRRQEERERRREREKRDWQRNRDRRNDRFGRYDERSYDRDQDDGGYARGTYDRDRDYERDRDYDRDRRDDRSRDRDYDRDRDRDRGHDRDKSFGRDKDRDYDRDRDRDRDRARSPPAAARSPPPAPPSAPTSTLSRPPPAPKPTASPAPDTRNMTADQRAAFIREQAQRRLQERMRALGVVTPGPADAEAASPTVDTTVEDRLVREKKEAEEKAMQAEKAAEERERMRRERLENERALKEGRPVTPSAAATTPATPPVPAAPAAAPRATAPIPPKRAPAPPPPAKRGQIGRPPIATPPVSSPAPPPVPIIRSPVPPAAPPAPAEPAEDPEEVALREREERLRKQKEARLERLRQLEREEEEARKAEEEYQNRRKDFMSPVTKSPTLAAATPPIAAQTPAAPPPPPAAPPAPTPPAAVSPPASDKASTNPFSKFLSQGGQSAAGTPSTPANGGTNPFFKPPQAAAVASSAPPAPSTISSPPVSRSPAPPAVKASYNTVPRDDDDWDDAKEIEDDDSSDDEFSSSRNARDKLAQQLFGGAIARPQSSGSSIPSQPQTPAPRSAPAAPAPPIPPPAPPAPTTAPVSPAAAIPAAPPAPPAPAPPAPAAPTMAAPVPAPAGDRGALLSSIAAGARLRKAVTNDRSAASVTGNVLGDTAPPPHINAAPRPASPPVAPSFQAAPPQEQDARANHRQSVDWYAGLAAEQGAVPAMPPRVETIEETEEEEPPAPTVIPEIQVQEAPHEEQSDLFADIDRSKEYRVRTLYAYEGQRVEDLSFGENIIVRANPSKSGGAWWYGTTVKEGKSGFFPSTYVQELENIKAKALYSYAGGNTDELPFVEGDEITIVDRSDVDWWKTEQGGVIFIVPAAYFEVVEGASVPRSTDKKEAGSEYATEQPPRATEPSRNSPPTAMTTAPEQDDFGDGEGTSSASDEEYHSFDSSDSEAGTHHDSASDGRKEHEARELERQRVLEAAGLLIKTDADDAGPPPRPIRRRSTRRRRRTPPQAPSTNADAQRASIISVSSEKDKELPPTPSSSSVLHVDDAFERYEAYRQSKNWRMSVSSIDSGPPSPGLFGPGSAGPGPTSMSAAPSKDSERDQRQSQSSHSHIFNFLTRSKTPTHEPERPRLQISAPILNAAHSAESLSRPGSPSFGSSWASLLGRDTLKGIPNLERKRQEAIFELINTEAAYVRDLQLIVQVFSSSLNELLSEKEVAVVFANIEDLLLVNTTFLSSLEERQKECRLYIDKIGDLLDRHMVNMGVYTEYCVNQGNAIKFLQSIRDSRPDVEAQLQRLRDNPSVRNLDLSSYLLSPMQRITRYPLLMRQVLHHTEGESDRNQIISALESVERVLNFINEAIREQEGRVRLETISKSLYVGQGRLDLAKSTSYMGARQLLKEGILMKYKSGRKLGVFLCNDMLILTDEKITRLYKMPIQLNQVDVKELPGKDELGFQLVFAYPRGGEAMAFKASSAQECKTWMKAIYSACRRARDIERRAAQKSASLRR